MPILDLTGVYCPMGCGQTLHRMTGGFIQCLSPECPDSGAAFKILASPEHLDVVEFIETSWTVLHPLKERLGEGLFSCPVHALCGQLDSPPGLGRYRASVGEHGDLVLEKIT